MSNQKFNSIMRNYFFTSDTDVKRFLHSQFINSKKDYYDFFYDFLYKFGIASFGIVVNIQNDSHRSYINFTNENIFNQVKGEVNIIENVTSDEANMALANKLIQLFDLSNYNDWIDNL